MTTKERKGYEWVGCGDSGGYWRKITGQKHSHKLPLFCPYELCQRPTGTIDDESLLKYGICKRCYVMLVEDRNMPLINVEEYARRLSERGY